jgi:hypothetical protein
MLLMMMMLMMMLMMVSTTRGNECEGRPDYGKKTSEIAPPRVYVSREEWGAEPWGDPSTCPISMDNITMITIHHTVTASPVDYDDGIVQMQYIQYLHQVGNGWSDVGYHFVTNSLGYLYQGRPFWDDTDFSGNDQYRNSSATFPYPGFIQGAHASNANSNNLGIAVMGCYDTAGVCAPSPSNNITRGDPLYNQLVDFVAFYADVLAVPLDRDHIVGHRDVGSTVTSCPGQFLWDLIPSIIADASAKLSWTR